MSGSRDWSLSRTPGYLITVSTRSTPPSQFRSGMKGDHLTTFHGFAVRKEDLIRSATQLELIGSMSDTDAQLSATLTETESAIGYLGDRGPGGIQSWTCYHSVKMKTKGLVAYFAHLVGENGPSCTSSWNTLTRSTDLRWCKQTVGVVAYDLVLRVRPFLHSEKTIAEADCIISHGPRVSGGEHPFVGCGAVHVRRGVWEWPKTS